MYYKSSCSRTPIKNALPRAQSTTPAPTSSLSTSLSSSKTNVHDSEFIYVDCIYHNTNLEANRPVQFEASRTTPILTERNNYKLGVISVSGRIIVPLITPDDPNSQHRKFFTIAIQWTTPAPVSGITVYQIPFPVIYTADDFVTLFNNSCVALWTQAQVDYDAAGGNWAADLGIPTLRSGLTYNNNTQCFTLYGDEILDAQFVYPSNNNRARFLLSSVVSGYLTGISMINNYSTPGQPFSPLPPPVGYEIPRFSLGFEDFNQITFGANNYLENVQDSPSIGAWNEVNSLVLISNSLGARRVDISRSSDIITNSTDATLNIVDSFPISFTGGLNRFITFANPNINYCDILSNGVLDRLSFSLWTLDSSGNLYPLSCSPNGTVNVKLVFARTTFTSN